MYTDSDACPHKHTEVRKGSAAHRAHDLQLVCVQQKNGSWWHFPSFAPAPFRASSIMIVISSCPNEVPEEDNYRTPGGRSPYAAAANRAQDIRLVRHELAQLALLDAHLTHELVVHGRRAMRLGVRLADLGAVALAWRREHETLG